MDAAAEQVACEPRSRRNQGKRFALARANLGRRAAAVMRSTDRVQKAVDHAPCAVFSQKSFSYAASTPL
jgi:hypothetical protein